MVLKSKSTLEVMFNVDVYPRTYKDGYNILKYHIKGKKLNLSVLMDKEGGNMHANTTPCLEFWYEGARDIFLVYNDQEDELPEIHKRFQEWLNDYNLIDAAWSANIIEFDEE